MNYSMCFKILKLFLFNWFLGRKKHRPKISILIPFSTKDPVRRENFKWLLRFWKNELPDAEIIIGKSKSKVFCKGEALNHAAKKAKGKVFVILDADAYLHGYQLEYCANMILEELKRGHHLWYVPYRYLYRLTKHVTSQILFSDPEDPYWPPDFPPEKYIENEGFKTKYGHRYGAMCMMFPREAYETLGCFDERFKGWGGEDIALLRALDTLWGKHKTLDAPIYHLWHPFYGQDYRSRKWSEQDKAGSNSELASKYHRATGHYYKMRELVNEGGRCEKK